MSFGSFLRGIAAQVNPFDNGQTYGTFNPPQKKKDDQNQTGTLYTPPAQNNQNNNQQQRPQLQAQKPQNLFAGLNNDLRLPGSQPNNNANVNQNSNQPATNPAPGTIFKPFQQNNQPAPQQNNQPSQIPNQNNTQVQHPSFWHSLTHNPVTNVVGGIGKTVASPFVYLGKTDIINPTRELIDSGNPIAEQHAQQQSNIDLGLSQRNPDGTVTGNDFKRGLERWAGNSAGALLTVAAPGASKALESGASSFLPEAAPSVVRTVAPKVFAGSQIGGMFNASNTVAQGDTNPMDLAKSYGTGEVAGGTLEGLAPVLSRFLPTNWLRNRGVNEAINEAEAEAPIEGAAGAEAVQPQQPTQIPVKSPDNPPVKIPVGTPPADNPWLIPQIKEIGGDFNFPTEQELQQIRVTNAQNAANDFNAGARPDQSVGGVIPPKPVQPYQVDPAAVKAAQDQVVKSYASMLKDVGQGNGTQLVPDGEGGYIRTTNNFRTPDNAGKNMTNQDWIDQAQKELSSGQAEPGHQQAFNDAANPEVQSLVAQGDQTAQPPVGKPITVKEVKGIPVTDLNAQPEKTIVPAGQVETPGTVRPTTTAAPANEKAAAVAAQPTVTPTVASAPSSIPLPKDTQAVLDNPKNFTKRQVAAARNQVKLARQYTKAQSQIDELTGRTKLPEQVPSQVNQDLVNEGRINGNVVQRPVKNLQIGSDALGDGLDEAQVQKVMQDIQAGKPIEPLVVSGTKYVQDGAHRLEAMKRLGIDNAPTVDQIPQALRVDKGFVSTGNFRKGAQGNITESASKATEAAQGAHDITNTSVEDVLNQARQEVNDNGIVSPQTVRNLKALRESGTLARTSPEFKAVTEEYRNAISNHARALSMTDRTARTTASGDQLTNRFISKLTGVAEDSGKLTDAHVKQIEDAENAFTQARDNATALGEQFKATGSPQDFKAWKTAQQAAEQADRQAKITEYLVSKDVLKGNKDMTAVKAIQDAEKNAGVYSMDSIDSNMLSGTGTMVRNYINTLFPRAENKLFGRASAVVAKKLARVDALGGSSGRGARIGSSIGKDMFKADVAARKEAGVGFIRRAVTAGNTIGEKNIEAMAYSKAFSHYKQVLKNEGYKGAELNNRAEFNVRTDPDGLVAKYQQDALQANALSGLTHSRKLENEFADFVQKKMSDNNFSVKTQHVARMGAKAVTRVGIGYPTVIGRSMYQGLLRTPPGALTEATFAVRKILTGDPEGGAQALNKAIQHLGSGSALITLGYAFGQSGLVSGPYPTDPAERARWTAEGREPDSIKVGGQWFQIPGYLGGFALPFMLGANMGNGSVKNVGDIKNAWKTALDVSPVDNFQTTADILTGKASGSVVKNAITSLVRTVTPAGSLVAETAKVFNPTKADTTTKSAGQNVLDQIGSGIPYVANKISEKTPKLDAYGNVIKNPNPVATILGAQGKEQSQGAQSVQKEQGASDQTFNEMNQYGVFQDKNLTQLIDPKLYKQMQEGQQLTPQDVQKIQKSVTKGIDASTDSSWRENGNYSTDKAALQVKLQMLNADPTSKPSEKQAYETQIKRDDVLQSNGIPYDALKEYESTSLSQWRAMGDSNSESYDPQTYQKLWAIDQLMAKGGASYKTGDPTAQKYSAKQPGSGSGSRRSSPITGDFGKLVTSAGAPKVQQYQSISTQSGGGIPLIARKEPNIVHNISLSKVQ